MLLLYLQMNQKLNLLSKYCLEDRIVDIEILLCRKILVGT